MGTSTTQAVLDSGLVVTPLPGVPGGTLAMPVRRPVLARPWRPMPTGSGRVLLSDARGALVAASRRRVGSSYAPLSAGLAGPTRRVSRMRAILAMDRANPYYAPSYAPGWWAGATRIGR